MTSESDQAGAETKGEEVDPISTRLREAAAALGSQKNAAQACGVAIATFQRWLKGTDPGLRSAARLAEAANVRLDWIAYGEGPKERRQSAHQQTAMAVEAIREAYAEAGVTAVAKPEIVRTAIAAAVDHNVRKPGLGWKIANQVLDLLAQYDEEEAEKARNRTKHLRDVD